MVNISSAFTPNGSRLLTKITNQVVKKEKGSSLETLENISSKARTFDYATLERNFGQDFVQVFSFKDENGKVIQKIQKTTGDKTTLKFRNYSDNGTSNNKTKKIEQKVYENGKLIQEKFDNIFTSVRGFFKNNYFMSKTSFNRDIINDTTVKANEQSLYGTFQNKKSPKKIIAIAQRNQDNSVNLKKIQFAGITKDEAKEISKDPYLTMRLLPTDDFLSTVRHKVYKDHDLTRAQIKTYKGNIGDKNTFAQARRNADGSLIMVLNKNSNAINSKPEVIDSLNHEAQHCRQFIYIEQLEHTQNFPLYSFNANIRTRQMNYGRIQDKETLKYAEEMQSATVNYVSPFKDINAYRNNATEVDARAAGQKAKDEYTSFANKIESVIPLTNEQLGL